MNYIKRLQQENADQAGRIQALENELSQFRLHIDGPKFVGVEADGGRRDWISTADVTAWIERLRVSIRFGAAKPSDKFGWKDGTS